MYWRIEGNQRMTESEACLSYPDNYILIQRDNEYNMFDPAGLILYAGDNFDELFDLQVNLPVPLGVVIEGLNYRRSLGGIVIGE